MRSSVSAALCSQQHSFALLATCSTRLTWSADHSQGTTRQGVVLRFLFNTGFATGLFEARGMGAARRRQFGKLSTPVSFVHVCMHKRDVWLAHTGRKKCTSCMHVRYLCRACMPCMCVVHVCRASMSCALAEHVPVTEGHLRPSRQCPPLVIVIAAMKLTSHYGPWAILTGFATRVAAAHGALHAWL